MQPNRQRNQRGYNLVEVLIAMGLLASVLLSIVTLFFFGRKNVYSGKQMTEAVAVGNHVMEDFANMTMAQVYSNFAVTGTPATANYTLFGTTYNNALIRSTDPNVVSGGLNISAEGSSALLTTWKNEIQKKFQAGAVTIIMVPTLPASPVLKSGTNNPAAKILQVHAIVSWIEEGRQRHIVLDTVKIRRGA
ncbi:MAG: prepilin-type N-terminal cleavage/methylation domain-containing protein [Thermoanaerobaculia bacterium]